MGGCPKTCAGGHDSSFQLGGEHWPPQCAATHTEILQNPPKISGVLLGHAMTCPSQMCHKETDNFFLCNSHPHLQTPNLKQKTISTVKTNRHPQIVSIKNNKKIIKNM